MKRRGSCRVRVTATCCWDRRDPRQLSARISCDNRGLERVMDGLWTRVKLAFAAFFTILFKGRLPAALQTSARPAAAPAAAAPAAVIDSDRAIQMLALLQRDGRLIDF